MPGPISVIRSRIGGRDLVSNRPDRKSQRWFGALAPLLIAGGFALVGCGDDAGTGADECRYENGRTYMEEVNHCNTMRDQGVQCIVPPPPVC
jgi:hypothetical protein